ncbi:MAG: TauD/TfdA family dioxygenase, partial [Thermoanaerobaculia bacterium]
MDFVVSDGPNLVSQAPTRLHWAPRDGAEAVRRALADEGIAHLAASAELNLDEAQRSPWSFVERLLGVRPELVERQTIRSLPDGRNFATGRMPAPFHTDSQCFFGVPPHVQLMLCVRAADEGGENRFVDGWHLAERLEQEEPALLERLFIRHRRIPFVFGDFFGPTISWRGESLIVTHAPRALPGDDLAPLVTAWLDRLPAFELRATAGEVLAIHNHRMLHGRR